MTGPLTPRPLTSLRPSVAAAPGRPHEPATARTHTRHARYLGLTACGVLLAVSTAVYAALQDGQHDGSDAPVADVVVGAQAGPRMWKVTQAQSDHVLWILGTVTPLPKGLQWQSDEVNAVLKESQEVIPGLPSVDIGWNPFTWVGLYFEWRRIQRSPDHEPLAQVLPPDLYARFEALKARYDPHDRAIEKVRPMIAAERLLEKSLDATGLTYRNEVQQQVLHLARRDGVRIHQDKVRVQQPVAVLRDVNEASRQGEIDCLESVISRLETDIGPMQERARAWALGDVQMIRNLPHPDNRTACIAAVSTSDRVKNLITRTYDDWLVSVQDALARNRSTLAVQTMDRLLGPDGALAALRKMGYKVEGP